MFPRTLTSAVAMSPILAAVLAASGCTYLYGYPSEGAEETAQACADGRDNDFDGLADCIDPRCAVYCVENTQRGCTDGKDNDVDGLTDCLDPECAGHCPETGGAACSDGEDDDTDGRADCADFDCVPWCPKMVNPPDGVWIDSTEVTREQYEGWLAKGSVVWSDCLGREVPAETFGPDATCMAEGTVCRGASCSRHPQVCVDWCGAQAYCRAAGERLCDGGEWLSACTSGGQRKFPYGDDPEPASCNGSEAGNETTALAGAQCRCSSGVSGYEGIYDLAGNVAEWIDDYDDDNGTAAVCGGAFDTPSPSCDLHVWERFDAPRPDIGFRCCADRCGDGKCGPLEECYDGKLCVAKQVSGTGSYAIDATEVTRSQYDAWVAAGPPASAQGARCAWNANYKPACEGRAHHPVVCVDWCDAYAYCNGVGKRLCGRIGAGPNGFGDYADATKSQWYDACSSGGVNNYPYGGSATKGGADGYEPETCNGTDASSTGCSIGTCDTVEAGSLRGCASKEVGYVGVYDLSGNVWEWEDSCSGDSGTSDSCRLRGGSFGNASEDLRCGQGHHAGRGLAGYNIGFRCCSL